MKVCINGGVRAMCRACVCIAWLAAWEYKDARLEAKAEEDSLPTENIG